MKSISIAFFITPEIVSKFDKIVATNNDKLKRLAVLERSGRNGFILYKGWESVNISHVRAYKAQATRSAHKHILAKLHPFIKV